MNESFILRVLDGLDAMMVKKLWTGEGISDTLIELAMVLACIFSLILVAKVLYKPMTGHGSIDILELGKPLLMALFLSNWFMITEAVFGIAKPLEEYFRSGYELDVTEIDKKRNERLLLAQRLDRLVADKKVDNEINETIGKSEEKEKNLDNTDYANEAGAEELEAEYFDSYNPMEHLGTKLMIGQSYLMNWAEKGFLWLSEIFWASSIFLVFLSKHIATVILVMFGPIMVSTSLLWPGSWKKWLSFSINVSFYGAIAFMVMTLCLKIIKYGIQADINLLNDTIRDEMSLMSYMKYTSSGSFGTLGLYVISLWCGSMLVLMVPTFASWVFPTDIVFRGASDFQTGIKNSIRTITTTTTVLVAGTIAGGPSVGVRAAFETSGRVRQDPSIYSDGHAPDTGSSGSGGKGGGPKSGGGGSYFSDEDKSARNTRNSHTAQSGNSQQPHRRRKNASASGNSWYEDVLNDEKRMAKLKLDLEAYEEAVRNGTEEEFLESLKEQHPEWENSSKERKMSDKREEFWDELKIQEKRKNVLDELDELLNKYGKV